MNLRLACFRCFDSVITEPEQNSSSGRPPTFGRSSCRSEGAGSSSPTSGQRRGWGRSRGGGAPQLGRW